MKNLVSIILVVLSFYSCTDSLGDDVKSCGDVTNVAFESFNYCGQLKENPKQPSYLIINSNEEMQKVFTTCETVNVALPDFTQKRILGIMSGAKPTGGYDIKIQSVIEDNCEIVVEFFEREPKKEDLLTMVVTYPTDYIVLPKSNKPVTFSRVNEIVDYAVVGTYYGQCSGADCYQFYRIENYKVLQYLKVNNFSSEFNRTNYKALSYKDDYAGFLLKVPTEIKNLKGQTKTFGSPDTKDQGGVYFEWSQGGVVTKIYFDTDDTTDQTPNIVAFKKAIRDKMVELKTKS